MIPSRPCWWWTDGGGVDDGEESMIIGTLDHVGGGVGDDNSDTDDIDTLDHAERADWRDATEEALIFCCRPDPNWKHFV